MSFTQPLSCNKLSVELALCSEFGREFSGQLCSLICATHSLALVLSHPRHTYVVFIHIYISLF
jgi:hypothetical protein